MLKKLPVNEYITQGITLIGVDDFDSALVGYEYFTYGQDVYCIDDFRGYTEVDMDKTDIDPACSLSEFYEYGVQSVSTDLNKGSGKGFSMYSWDDQDEDDLCYYDTEKEVDLKNWACTAVLITNMKEFQDA